MKLKLIFDKICDECSYNADNFLTSIEMHLFSYLLSSSKQELKDELFSLYQTKSFQGTSLLHENGFTKISIYKCPKTKMQIRLHRWPKGSDDVNIHNHRWDLFGYCIKGKLRCQNFTTEPQPDAIAKLYEVCDADENLEKKRTLLYSTNIINNCTYDLNEGNTHFLHYNMLHRVEVPEDCYTLFISGPPKRDFSHVVYEKSPSKKRFAVDEEICQQLIMKL